MKKLFLLWLFGWCLTAYMKESAAQGQISIHAGGTVSDLRIHHPPIDQIEPGFQTLLQLPPLVCVYIGLEYEHQFEAWRIGTGLSLLTMGAGRSRAFGTPMAYSYFTVPLTLGYQVFAYRQWQLTVKGGFEVGHWGLNEFRSIGPISYYHTGATTYLGYTLWDHARCKARRLKKQQAKALD